jgi:dihydrofolate reductase
VKITLIAALDETRAIGRAGQLPWRLPDDLKRFKALTLGKTVLMGRKTFESIGRPLPQRRNIVLTRDSSFAADSFEVVRDLQDALEDDLFVIGGGEVYALALPLATHLELTMVQTVVADADAFFPAWDGANWLEKRREHHAADERHMYAFDFVTLERR